MSVTERLRGDFLITHEHSAVTRQLAGDARLGHPAVAPSNSRSGASELLMLIGRDLSWLAATDLAHELIAVGQGDLRRAAHLATDLHRRCRARELRRRRLTPGIGQPAASKHIKALEAHLGVYLFARTTRRVRLTPTGAAVLPRVRKALVVLDAALVDVRVASD